MKLTILGSGTCVPGFTKSTLRFSPGFLLEFDGKYILFECGQGVADRLVRQGVQPTEVQHLAISHAHPDHDALVHHLQTIYVSGLVDAKYKMKELNVYCPPQIEKSFPARWFAHLPAKNKVGYPWPKLNFHPLSAGESIAVAGGKLFAYDVHHDYGKMEARAYRFEYKKKVFVYSGDTGLCGGIVKAAQGADLFICEASARIGQNNNEYGHLNPKQAGEIAQQVGVKKIMLFHHFGQDSDKAMIKELKSVYHGKVGICHDFEKVKF